MKESYDLYKQWNTIEHYEETNLKGAHCEIPTVYPSWEEKGFLRKH